ncbi:condensation domain-containing protein [Paenibacillus sp. FSL H3-0333]|uniref:condensation domain-containing protein n=1 Tax=Paenibacillus sp. FSL H3-0333 TaxID=2921373 RepID=UPI0030F65515
MLHPLVSRDESTVHEFQLNCLEQEVSRLRTFLLQEDLPERAVLGICTASPLFAACCMEAAVKSGWSYVYCRPCLSSEDVKAIVTSYSISIMFTDRNDLEGVRCFNPEKDGRDAQAGYQSQQSAIPGAAVRLTGKGTEWRMNGREQELYYSALSAALQLRVGENMVVAVKGLNPETVCDLVIAFIRAGRQAALSIQPTLDLEGISANTTIVAHERIWRTMLRTGVEQDKSNLRVFAIGAHSMLNRTLDLYRENFVNGLCGFFLSARGEPFILAYQNSYEEVLPFDGQYELVPAGKPLPPGNCILLNERQHRPWAGAVGTLYTHWNHSYSITDCQGFYDPEGSLYIRSASADLQKADPGLLEEILSFLPELREVRMEIGGGTLVCLAIAEPSAGCDETTVRKKIKDELPLQLQPGTINLIAPGDGANAGRNTGEAQMGHALAEKWWLPTDKADSSMRYEAIGRSVMEVLNRTNLDFDDNFFDMGLDSISAMRLAVRLRKEGFQADIRCIFTAPTVRSLSLALSRKGLDEIFEDKHVVLKERYVEESLALIRSEKDRKYGKDMLDSGPGIEAIYPLTPMQQVILAQNLNYRNTGLDVVIMEYRLNGRLQPVFFEAALKETIRRHPVLRSGFLWRRLSHPLQVVYQDPEFKLEQENLLELAPEFREERYRSRLAEVRTTGFNIAEPPLLRALLFASAPQEWIFALVCQSSLFDGWSSNLIFNDVIRIYSAFVHGEETRLNPAEPFICYAKWLEAQDVEAARSYWVKELSSWVPPISRPPVQMRSHYEPEEIIADLSAEVLQHIQSFKERNRITAHTILLGAWAMLQAEMAENSDVLISMIVSGRPESLDDADSIVGLFSNTVLLRVANGTLGDIDERLSWLSMIQEKVTRQKPYEYQTLQQIAEWCKLPVESLQQAVYTGAFVYLNFPMDITESMGEDLSFIPLSEAGYVSAPFRMYVHPINNHKLILRYDGYYFKKPQAEQWLSRYADIVKQLVYPPQGGREHE